MRRVKGFSLIELMVAVSIVAFLAAVAYPSYTSFVTEARRGEAMKELYRFANLQEQYYLDSDTYASVIGDLKGDSSVTSYSTESGFYTLTASAATSTFTITATPVTGESQAADSDCQSFTIDESGTRTATDADGTDTTTTCWGY